MPEPTTRDPAELETAEGEGDPTRSEMLEGMTKTEIIAIALRNERKAETEAKRAAQLADTNLKLTDKLKKSVLTDKDKRELTLAVRSTTTDIMDPVRYEQLRLLSRDMFNSGQTPKTYESEAQVFSAMQMGVEMGLTPSQAVLQGYFIGGRYEVWGSATGAILRKKGYRWRFVNEDPEHTEIDFWHKDSPYDTIHDEYSYEEAELSGFTTQTSKYNGQVEDKLGWRAGINRKRKMRYGIIDLVANTYLPDIFGAMTGVTEYAQDYMDAQADQDARQQDTSKEAKTERKGTIEKAMASYNKKPLEEVTPRAVETEAPEPSEEEA